MPRVVRSSQALIDVTDIVEYVARFNRTAARQLLRQFNSTFTKLAKGQISGEGQPSLGPSFRTFSVGKTLKGYLIQRIFPDCKRFEPACVTFASELYRPAAHVGAPFQPSRPCHAARP